MAEDTLILMDCCRIAPRLSVDALAREMGLPPPKPRAALMLNGDVLAETLRKEQVMGQAFVYANGCVVTAGMEPQDTQDLLLVLASETPHADFTRMMMMRDIRRVPARALSAQARALSSSVVLDALEGEADRLLDVAEQALLTSQGLLGRIRRKSRAQELLGQVAAFRYECVRGQGVLDRPDTKWEIRNQVAYRALSATLQLRERTALLAHKTEQLERMLLRAHSTGSTGSMMRQLWLEAWLLLFFPLVRLFMPFSDRMHGLYWLQQWIRSLRLY